MSSARAAQQHRTLPVLSRISRDRTLGARLSESLHNPTFCRRGTEANWHWQWPSPGLRLDPRRGIRTWSKHRSTLGSVLLNLNPLSHRNFLLMKPPAALIRSLQINPPLAGNQETTPGSLCQLPPQHLRLRRVLRDPPLPIGIGIGIAI